MFGSFQNHLQTQLAQIRAAGLYKTERIITTPQDAHVRVGEGEPVLNLCANNYLGLAGNPEVIAAAHAALDRWGYGLSSVRFICGTQELHKQLEECESIPSGLRWTLQGNATLASGEFLLKSDLGDVDGRHSTRIRQIHQALEGRP